MFLFQGKGFVFSSLAFLLFLLSFSFFLMDNSSPWFSPLSSSSGLSSRRDSGSYSAGTNATDGRAPRHSARGGAGGGKRVPYRRRSHFRNWKRIHREGKNWRLQQQRVTSGRFYVADVSPTLHASLRSKIRLKFIANFMHEVYVGHSYSPLPCPRAQQSRMLRGPLIGCLSQIKNGTTLCDAVLIPWFKKHPYLWCTSKEIGAPAIWSSCSGKMYQRAVHKPPSKSSWASV